MSLWDSGMLISSLSQLTILTLFESLGKEDSCSEHPSPTCSSQLWVTVAESSHTCTHSIYSLHPYVVSLNASQAPPKSRVVLHKAVNRARARTVTVTQCSFSHWGLAVQCGRFCLFNQLSIQQGLIVFFSLSPGPSCGRCHLSCHCLS